jgi:predicted 3-demethylubiquinone-9 3-methyltransferase (glyoxalase superfamily)
MPTQITPNLWFDKNAEEAAEHYVSIFPNSRIVAKADYPEGSDQAGSVVTVAWELDGTRFVGINGGPQFTFSEAISFQVDCKDQDEIDFYWDKLGDGGQAGPCGWLKDRFGVSWQIVPAGMDDFFADPDPERVRRAWDAMMKMGKIDVAAMHAAADGVAA